MRSLTAYQGMQNITSLDCKGDFIAATAAFPFINSSGEGDSTAYLLSRESGKILKRMRGEDRSYSSASLSDDTTFAVFLEKTRTHSSLVVLNTASLQEERIVLPHQAQKLVVSDHTYILMEEKKIRGKAIKGRDAYVYGENRSRSRVYVYRHTIGFIPVTGRINVWDFDARNDVVISISSNLPGEDEWFRSRVFVSRNGKDEMIYNPFPRQAARPVISHDLGRVAFLESRWSDRGITSGNVIHLKLADREVVDLTEGDGRSYGTVIFTGNGRMVATFNEEGRYGLSFIDEEYREIWRGDGAFQPSHSPVLSSYGDLFYLSYTDPKNPPEIVCVNSQGQFRRLSDINGHINFKPVPHHYLEWKSRDGLRVTGILRMKRKTDPLVVYLHGGPTSSSTLNFLDVPTILASEGFSIFMPNYRGSTGMGRSYAEANIGDMGGRDVDDILSGIDYLLEHELIRTDRIMVTGGSYGGFLTNLLICKRKFSAAVSLFGISDWRSFHGTTQVPVWDMLYYRSRTQHWEKHEKFSPLNYVSSVKTPVLIMHGEMDMEVPVSQSLQFYRELMDLHRRVKLLIFPREGHGFREKAHQEQYINEMIKWFKKFS